MNNREAMKLALEALEDSMYPQKKQFDAIVGLKQALAQEQTKCPRCNEANPAEIHTCSPQVAQFEQEPVAYLCENAVGYKYLRWKKPTSHYKPIALYTAPPIKPWVGLTDEEIKDILDCGRGGLVDIKKAEQILKEKNT